MGHRPKKKRESHSVATPRKKRSIGEMIHRLETQLELLRQHSEQAFGRKREEYYGEVATKLRILLVRKNPNTPLLLEIAERLEVPLNVTLGGPPVQPLKGEPGPGDTVTLDCFFDLRAVHIRTSAGLVGISKRKLICAWCEQLGGAHEDWGIEEAILNSLEFPLLINGTSPNVIELHNCARIALEYGDQLLDHIAHSEAVVKLFAESDDSGDQDPEVARRAAQGYGWLGEFMRKRGNVEGAAQMIDKAMTMFEGLGHGSGMAATYNSKGIIETIRGDFDNAEALFRKALEINENLRDLEGVAMVRGNLGRLAHDRGDLDAAEQYYQQALELNRQVGRMEEVATNYGNLGVLNWERGDLNDAERMYREALEIDQHLGRYDGIARQCYNLAEVQAARGEVAAAREMWTKARDLFARIGAKQLASETQDMIDKLPN
jgi:tetratricopeptide (TPR) repeat protein